MYCNERNASLTNFVVAITFVFTIVQLLVAVVSFVYLARRLGGGLVDSKERKKTLRLHGAYVVVFFIPWFLQRVVQNISGHNGVHQVVVMLWTTQAFFVAVVRLCEPNLFPAFLLALRVPRHTVARLCPAAFGDGVLAAPLLPPSDPGAQTSSPSLSLTK